MKSLGMGSMLAVSMLAAPSALAAEQVTIDLTGLQLKHQTDQTRDSSPNTIDPAIGYRYQLDGKLAGNGGVLGLFFPTPTPIDQLFESLLPGSSAVLMADLYNPSGAHPFDLIDERVDKSGTIGVVNYRITMTLRAGIDAGDVAFFSFSDVTMEPSSGIFQLGSLRFTEGTLTLTRIPVLTGDMNWDGSVDTADIDAFVTALTDPATYVATYGFDPILAGDINRDGRLDNFDLDPFLKLTHPPSS